jgi:hypothetical protein
MNFMAPPEKHASVSASTRHLDAAVRMLCRPEKICCHTSRCVGCVTSECRHATGPYLMISHIIHV